MRLQRRTNRLTKRHERSDHRKRHAHRVRVILGQLVRPKVICAAPHHLGEMRMPGLNLCPSASLELLLISNGTSSAASAHPSPMRLIPKKVVVPFNCFLRGLVQVLPGYRLAADPVELQFVLVLSVHQDDVSWPTVPRRPRDRKWLASVDAHMRVGTGTLGTRIGQSCSPAALRAVHPANMC